MEWIYNDGGRSNYYKAKDVGDCVCRALAIATGTDYKVMYNLLKGFDLNRWEDLVVLRYGH